MAEYKLSPMMSKYLETKEEYPDCILFYRLGDFYEMFFDDALTASRELELTLTGKSCGLENRAPMCGVPFHSASIYVQRLVAKGYKVAICEQLESAAEANGLVERGVIRVVTPGTLTDENMLDEKKNNYLCVIFRDSAFSLTFCDMSTGEVYVTTVFSLSEVTNELSRYLPSEILVNSKMTENLDKDFVSYLPVSLSPIDDGQFEADEEKILSQFKAKSIKALGLTESGQGSSISALLRYIEHTQKGQASYIDTLNVYLSREFMDIDNATRRNLEITETMRDKAKNGSLLGILDKTKTSMGARKLKQWLEKPLINPIEINKRLYSVDELFKNVMLRDDLRELLSGIYDIARISSRISLGSASLPDMLSLKASLSRLPELNYLLSRASSPMLSEMNRDFDIMADIYELLEESLYEEGEDDEQDKRLRGNIKGGYSGELDELRAIATDGRAWILSTEAEERERTGIKNLKIGYNKIFGYYIEVTKLNSSLVPDYYIRKQTLVNAERYITPQLKEMESRILNASEQFEALDQRLFSEIRARVSDQLDRLKRVCEIVSCVDALASFAEVAFKNSYVMPEVVTSGELVIKDGRHPVVEKTLKNSIFVPNDTTLDTAENCEIIITGPNMAGKSTYMRQVALISLMAQVGSFVPAAYAKIGVLDRIFTRVGASDDIGRGQSTFMLEMVEVANILKNATDKSLVILDEIGRGTSTYDGLSIAWAVAEHMPKKIGAKTLFATHYHELTQLENTLYGIKNYSVAVKKHGDDITFLRKIVRGGTDDSFGIEVSALAGVPKSVIRRAKEILANIESGEKTPEPKHEAMQSPQIGFEDRAATEIFDELRDMDVTTYTPIEALNKLYELSKKAKD